MPKQIKSTFHPPHDEVVTCPYCGQVIRARWVTDTEVEVTGEVCPHYVGHDRTVFYFYQQGSEPPPWDWDPEKTHHHN